MENTPQPDRPLDGRRDGAAGVGGASAHPPGRETAAEVHGNAAKLAGRICQQWCGLYVKSRQAAGLPPRLNVAEFEILMSDLVWRLRSVFGPLPLPRPDCGASPADIVPGTTRFWEIVA